MTLVIFGYPLHYHIMQLAHRSALYAFTDVTKVVVVWDDLYSAGPVSKSLTVDFPNASVMRMSEIEFVRDEPVGWLRQQYVKLNLHRLLSDDCWILLDGDTVLRNKKQLVKDDAVVVYGDPYEYFEPYFVFIKHSLGLEKNNLPSFMSPYWLCERQVLQAIEHESINRNNTDIVTAWKHYYRISPKSSYQSLSEVELYGLFASQVLNKKFEFAPQNLKCCLTGEFLDHWNNSQDICLGGPDDFPASFWDQQGIEYHRDLAVELQYKNIS